MRRFVEITMDYFFQFSSAITRFLLLNRRLGIGLCMQPNYKSEVVWQLVWQLFHSVSGFSNQLVLLARVEPNRKLLLRHKLGVNERYFLFFTK